MSAVNPILSQPGLNNSKLFKELDNKPWMILRDSHERVHYQFDGVAEALGYEETKRDGIGFCFDSIKQYRPGNIVTVGFPLPDSVRSYQAQVMSVRERFGLYQIGIWLPIETRFDLLTILRSCDYLDIRHTS